MKNTIFTLVITLLTLTGFSQSEAWNKTDRTNLYDDCLGYVTKYKNTTADQRESISLCYMEEFTKKYTKADFQTKIEIELKRIKEAVINQCAKNLGIDLSTTEAKKEEVVVEKVEKKEVVNSQKYPTKSDLLGKWKTDKGNIVEFKDGGKYNETTIKGVVTPGDWFLDDKGVLTINREYHYEALLTKKPKVDIIKDVYNIESFSSDFLKYSREGVPETIQANKMK